MNLEKKLEQNGVFPEEELKIDKKIEIAKNVASKLCSNFKMLENSYNEIYMRICNCAIFYAKIDEKFCGVFYYYKNNSIYIDREKQVDEYLIREIIHYLQNFSKIDKNDKKIGLCKFEDYRILAFGINEAMVQYITSKSMGNNTSRANFGDVSIYTNSFEHYKFLTSLICQIIYFVGEDLAVESCLKSNDNFIEQLYNTYEEQTEKILKKFDNILEENNKEQKNEEKIISLYFETQEMLYTVYFNKIMRYINETKDVDIQVEKLENYENIIGKRLNEDSVINKFKEFKSKTESKLLREYVEISRRESKKNLPVIYKNAIHKIFDKIARFFKGRKAENK